MRKLFLLAQVIIVIALVLYGLNFFIKDQFWLNLSYYYLLALFLIYLAYDHNRSLRLGRNIIFGGLSYNPSFILLINIISSLSFIFSIIFLIAIGIKTSWLNSLILLGTSTVLIGFSTALVSMIIPITIQAVLGLSGGIALMIYVLLELYKVFF